MLQYNVQLVVILVHVALLPYVLAQPCRRSGKCVSRSGGTEGLGDLPVPPMGNSLGQGNQKGMEEEGPPRKKCCPYDFDSKRCKVIDERVLCGYNRNAGWPQSRDTVRELSEGCRLRGGRLECGYQQEPYFNLRRPPAWDNSPDNGDSRKQRERDGDDDDQIIESERQKLILQKNTVEKSAKKPTAHCVEDGDRLVCKPIEFVQN